jgi:hypothetical protein
MFVMKKVGPETFPTACTWPENSLSATKKVAPESSSTAYTWPVQPIYVMKKVGPEISVQHINDLYSLYT